MLNGGFASRLLVRRVVGRRSLWRAGDYGAACGFVTTFTNPAAVSPKRLEHPARHRYLDPRGPGPSDGNGCRDVGPHRVSSMPGPDSSSKPHGVQPPSTHEGAVGPFFSLLTTTLFLGPISWVGRSSRPSGRSGSLSRSWRRALASRCCARASARAAGLPWGGRPDRDNRRRWNGP